MEFIFERTIVQGNIGGSRASIDTGGRIISVSEDLVNLGCPTTEFNKALVWLAHRRDLGMPKRTRIPTRTGERVTLTFEKQVADTGKKVALPRFVTERKNRVPVP